MSTRAEKNKVCQTILDWQNERGLEGWNEDQIDYGLGIQVIDKNTLIFVDESDLLAESNIIVEFKDGKSGLYKLEFDEETHLYSISKISSRNSKKVEDEETEETEEDTSEEEE